MAGYSLIATEQTVQVLSPTVVMDVVYATIQTSPSGVIASLAVSKEVFDAGTAGVLLQDYANNIEQLMGYSHVIAGTGTQTIDATGLIQENVAFIVQYVPASGPASTITAEAIVPAGLLSEGGDPQIESVLMAEARAIIDKVYANLKNAAGG